MSTATEIARPLAKGIAFASNPAANLACCCFPSVVVAPNGDWLCTCRAAPLKSATLHQSVLLTRSVDQGKTWSKPVEPWKPEAVNGHAGALRVGYLSTSPDGRVHAALAWTDVSRPELPLFNDKTEGVLDFRIFVSESSDDGRTWSTPLMVDRSPFDQPVPLTGPILHLPGGERGVQFELNKHFDDTSVWRHLPVIKFSADGGKTWPRYAHPAGDPTNRIFYWDQRTSVLSDGSLFSLFWTYDTRDAKYFNIHSSESTDGGHTWSAPRDTGVPGQPAWPVEMDDGAIVAAYVDRTTEPAIKVRVSRDRGKTWPASSEQLVYRASMSQEKSKRTMQDAWAEMSAFSVGLPAAMRVAPGRVFVTFYAGPDADHTDIRWAVVDV